VRPQRVVLENHADVALLGRDLTSSAEDGPSMYGDAPFVGALQPRQHAQHGRLAAAGRPEQGHELALGDTE